MATAKRFKRQFDKSYKGIKCEVPKAEKVTKPSMTMTVRELMERHTRGVETGQIHRDGVFMDDVEIPRIHDLTDLEEHRKTLKERQKQLEKELKTIEDEHNKRKKEQLEQKAKEKEEEAEKPDPDPTT